MNYTSRILIVDDRESARETLAALLHNQGYELAFASDGPEALEKAAELLPDVILLDVMMPGMDGFEVCRRLRDTPQLTEVPIIMVTALDDRTSLLTGIEAGADEFLSKPFDRVELRTRIQTIVRLNRYRRLQAERLKFKWVVEQADDGYLIVDDDDNILYANPKARLFFNLPSTGEDEPISETFMELAGQQYNLQPSEAWSEGLKQPGDVRQQRYLVRPETQTAQSFWLRVDMLDMAENVDVGQIVRLRDVTEQVELKRDSRGFHAFIFHKLRTPLIGMVSGLEFLAESAPELDTEEVVSLADMALSGVRRLHGEIEDVLQYANTTKLVQPDQSFSLSQLPSLVDQISEELSLTDVALTGVDSLDDVQLSLSGQAVELILTELLENAKKFHPEQSPSVYVVASRSQDQIKVQVVDDGLTLSPEQLAQVWTPYYQGEKFFTGQTTGMGLGLPMVASLIWNVGGECHLYNRPDGDGVVVELLLPMAEKN